MNEKRRRASAEPKLTEKRRNFFNEDGNEDDNEGDLSSFYSPPSQVGVRGRVPFTLA
jgi:hypothetical protein